MKRKPKRRTMPTGAVLTEAKRLAKNMIKDEIRRQGVKVSYVKASDIAEAALELIKQVPEITRRARLNCKGY